MPPNYVLRLDALRRLDTDDDKIKCAVLGCGMMGQEHISYIAGYSALRVDFLCDPYEPSLEKAVHTMNQFNSQSGVPILLKDEKDLLTYARDIDLLVIASPNYLHTESLLRWGKHDITILVEKPVAVSQDQHDLLQELSQQSDFIARIWVGMEYRYIPAIAKLLSLLPDIGELKMCTIRENRYPFLHKIGAWNRDPNKTGDTLVEKCCHFFDLFRLITGKEMSHKGVRSLAQRGLLYEDEPNLYEKPIMDAAFVVMPFRENCTHGESIAKQSQRAVMGCLELCMYAEGSRHQEEITVTGTKVRGVSLCIVQSTTLIDSYHSPLAFILRVVWRPIFPKIQFTSSRDPTRMFGKIAASLLHPNPSTRWSLTVLMSRMFTALTTTCRRMAATTTVRLPSNGTISFPPFTHGVKRANGRLTCHSMTAFAPSRWASGPPGPLSNTNVTTNERGH
jgi:predicted dehydrogenase